MKKHVTLKTTNSTSTKTTVKMTTWENMRLLLKISSFYVCFYVLFGRCIKKNTYNWTLRFKKLAQLEIIIDFAQSETKFEPFDGSLR